MIRNTSKLMLLGSTLLATGSVAFAEDVTLTVESWRNDDLQIWQEKSSRRLKPSIRASRSISHQAHQRNIMPRSMPSLMLAPVAISLPAVRSTPRWSCSTRASSPI